MLQTLYVKNLALIDEAEVTFGPGLNILSGETGAGKSILIGSIHIALGGKVPRDVIRTKADSAYMELVFRIEDEERTALLRAAGVEPEDGQIVISRKLTAGKSISRVNGEYWPAVKIAGIAGLLLDVYGQHEHETLLRRRNHLEILDEYCAEQTAGLRTRVREECREYHRIQKELEAMNQEDSVRKREIAFLQFAVEEIEEAALTAGEDEELTARYKKLVNQKQLVNGIEQMHEILGYDEKEAVGEQVGQAIRVLQRISSYDEEGLCEIQSQLYDLESLLTDLNQSISAYGEEIEADEESLDEIEKRLDQIHDLKSKYGGSIPEILSYAEEQSRKLDELQHYEERRAKREADAQALCGQLREDCKNLSAMRKAAARRMEQRIVQALQELNFLQVKFEVSFRETEGFTENGTDDVEFLISTNPGEALKPLVQVASGGELSRIMLAIKTVLADADHIPTLIFDEIDTGISGRTAQMVSEKLAYISREHQVICISHLPQIVAMADSHYLIEKQSDTMTTNTRIAALNADASVREIARLLGGAKITQTTYESAREMKEQADRRKDEVRNKNLTE